MMIAAFPRSLSSVENISKLDLLVEGEEGGGWERPGVAKVSISLQFHSHHHHLYDAHRRPHDDDDDEQRF